MQSPSVATKPHLISAREQERLRKLFPHFEFDFSRPETFSAGYGSRRLVFNCTMLKPMDWERALTEWHCTVATEQRLRERYPDLWIAVRCDFTGLNVSIWLKRGDRDAEGIRLHDVLYVDDPNLHVILAGFQSVSSQAKQDGWFFCTGHNQAEECHDGMFHHFAARYCKQYGAENPGVLAAARAERYN